MGLIKRRPKIVLNVPSEIRAGDAVEARVLLDARREVPVTAVAVRLDGIQRVSVGAGDSSRSDSTSLLALSGLLSGATTLRGGVTELRCRFDLPRDLPPSYTGRGASVDYEVTVHVEIPWWRDAHEVFQLHVLPRESGERPGRPRLFSSAPDGPSAREPHVEGSLAGDVFAPGDVVSGAVALGNVAYNAYRGVTVALLGWQTVRLGRTVEEVEAGRYETVLRIDPPRDGEPVPFAFRVPARITPTFATPACRLDWHVEITAQLGWKKDLRLRVPATIVAPPAGDQRPAPRSAPPSVGSSRVTALWQEVADRYGWALRDGALVGTVAEATVELRREHRGADGIFLVGELRWAPLHLGLAAQRAGRLAALRSRMKIGHPEWDRRHRVTGRDETQVAAFCAALGPPPPELVELGDERALIERRDAGHDRQRLARYAQLLGSLAQAVAAARQRIQPPAVMASGLASWRELAERLGGRLETARMAIRGAVRELPAEVVTEWSPDGAPERTRLVLRPAYRLGKELAGPAEAAAAQLRAGAVALELGEDAVELHLPAPIQDASVLVPRLEELAKLCALLRADAVGPYR